MTISGTKEWASTTFNICNGCPNGCKYCYASAMAYRYGRKEKYCWTEEKLISKQLLKRFGKRKGTIMFPSTHDITVCNLEYCKHTILKMLAANNKVLIVTKPNYYCMSNLANALSDYKHRVLFRFTIGSHIDKTLKFWEPHAPGFEERLNSLRLIWQNRYETSVSCEPYLDDSITDLVETVLPYITNSVWIGKANRLMQRIKINGFYDNQTINAANNILQLQSDVNVIQLYESLKHNPKIKWKESIKKVLGLELPTEKGLDI